MFIILFFVYLCCAITVLFRYLERAASSQANVGSDVNNRKSVEARASCEMDLVSHAGNHEGQRSSVSVLHEGNHEGQNIIALVSHAGNHEGQRASVSVLYEGNHEGQNNMSLVSHAGTHVGQSNIALVSHTGSNDEQNDMVTSGSAVINEDNNDINMGLVTACCHGNEGPLTHTTSSSIRPVIRASFDVHILHDTDHSSADDHLQLVRLLETELDRLEYKYTNCVTHCLPGRSTSQQQVDMMTQADFVICFLSIPQQTGEMCSMLSHCVQKAFVIKRNQGLTNRVIPVMCNMSENQVRQCVCKVTELMLTDHIPAREGDTSWIERVMAALAATPTGWSHLSVCTTTVIKPCHHKYIHM